VDESEAEVQPEEEALGVGTSLGSRVVTGLALAEAVPWGLGESEAVLRDSVGDALAELLPVLNDSCGDALGELLPVLNDRRGDALDDLLAMLMLPVKDSLGDVVGELLPVLSDCPEVCDGEPLKVVRPHARGSSSRSKALAVSPRFIAAGR
jgi:hypothetical protein